MRAHMKDEKSSARRIEPWMVLWRPAVVLAFAFWWGGFTFYSGVVIHIGTDIFGKTEQGFVTQQATNALNAAGAALSIVLLANSLFMRGVGKGPIIGLWVSWAIIAACQAGQYFVHSVMDGFLVIDPDRRVTDIDQFWPLHRIYIKFVTAQWAAGILHIACVLTGWRRIDRAAQT